MSAAAFIGPLRLLASTAKDDARFTLTGGVFAQPVHQDALQPAFYGSDCGALDAPDYVPMGGVMGMSHGRYACAVVSIRREGLL